MTRSDMKMLGESGYERKERDLYETEPAVTIALCEWLCDRYMLSPASKIWECACGGGKMVDVLRSYFGEVYASDIVPLCDGVAANFLEVEAPPPVTTAIITNPPFGKDLDLFIARALGHLRQPGATKLVAFVARSEVSHASTRRRFFGD